MGQKNLIIDLDPQGNATTGLGKSNQDEEKNIYNILIQKNKIKRSFATNRCNKFRSNRIEC